MNQLMNSLVQVNQLYKEFPVNSGFLDQLSLTGVHLHLRWESVKVINGVDLEIIRGEALCLIGESGCGKPTMVRVIMGLNKPASGTVYYEG